MRTPLKVALAVAVAGAVWVSTQSSDDGVELASPDKRGASSSASRGGNRNEASERDSKNSGNHRSPKSAQATSGAASNPLAWTDAALAEGVQAWRLRTTEAQALPPARAMTQASPSAWASMAPPPPPKVKAPPPPPPMAPRFPHEWIGRINDDTVVAKTPPASASQPALAAPIQRPIQRAVLAGPVSTWVVAEGDVIDGQWRVDRIQDRTMTLTYLPLQLSQTVNMK